MDLPKDTVTYVPFLPSCHEIDFSSNEPYLCLCRQYFPDLHPATIYKSISFRQAKSFMQILLKTIICMLEYWERFKADFDNINYIPLRGVHKSDWLQVVGNVQLLIKQLQECLQCGSDVEKYTGKIQEIRKDSNFHTNLVYLSYFSIAKSPISELQKMSTANILLEAALWFSTVAFEKLTEIGRSRFSDQITMVRQLQETRNRYNWKDTDDMSIDYMFNMRHIIGSKIAEIIDRLFKSGPFPDEFINALLFKRWCRITELELILPVEIYLKLVAHEKDFNAIFCLLIGMTAKEHVLSHCLFMIDPILLINLH